MKPRKAFFSTLMALAVVCGALGSTGMLAQTRNGLGEPESNEFSWGDPTNGIAGGVSIHRVQDGGEIGVLVEVVLKAVGTKDGSPMGRLNPYSTQGLVFGDSRSVVDSMRQPGGLGTYFRPTNRFCGPIALHDQEGNTVPLSKPGICSAEGYPKAFRLKEIVEEKGKAKAGVWISPPQAEPLVGRRPTLATFKLEDYFELNSPGQYVLTVWPKVYKRVEVNDDLCQLVDVPPISKVIVWDSPKGRK